MTKSFKEIHKKLIELLKNSNQTIFGYWHNIPLIEFQKITDESTGDYSPDIPMPYKNKYDRSYADNLNINHENCIFRNRGGGGDPCIHCVCYTFFYPTDKWMKEHPDVKLDLKLFVYEYISDRWGEGNILSELHIYAENAEEAERQRQIITKDWDYEKMWLSTDNNKEK